MSSRRQIRASAEGDPPADREIADEDSDVVLVGELQRGAPGAVARLYDRYGDDVERVVWRLLGADAEHDDVVQQAFVAAMGAIHSLTDPTALRAWLRAVTVNTVRTELNRRVLRRRLSLGLLAEPAAAQTDFVARGELERVRGLLERLPVEERLAFCLRHVAGLSLEEAAEALGVSLATLKRRLRRAVERFTRLAQKDPDLAERLRRGAADGEEDE